MLNSKQRAFLRGLANRIDTILNVGKGEITDNNIKQADVVQVIGSKFVLYRRNDDEPVIELPKAKK